MQSNINIVGISGRISSGKNTIASMIQFLTSGLDESDYESWSRKPIQYLSSKESPWEVKAFAGKLKQIASILTGVPVEKFEDQEFKESYMKKEWTRYFCWGDKTAPTIFEKYTYRTFLQRLGTESMRDGLHQNVWLNALWSDYKPVEDVFVDEELVGVRYPKWLITDMRFKNEAKSVKDHGGITLRLTRNSTTPAEHPSETDLDKYSFDYVIDNEGQSLEETFAEVQKFIKHFDIK